MAEILKQFPTPRRHWRSLYAWDEWLNGKVWQLRNDHDFHVETRTFLASAYNAAKARGLKVRSQAIEGHVVIQAIKGGKKK